MVPQWLFANAMFKKLVSDLYFYKLLKDWDFSKILL